MMRRNFLIKSYSYILLTMPALHACGVYGATTPAVELLPFDAGSLATLRKTHSGKPFVLAFWSVYCEPCRDEMAEWNAVKRKHPSLPIVLVSTDAPTDRALIEDFLKKYPPGPVQKWVFADAFSERVRYSVDKSWRGELPKSYFFDSTHRTEVKSGKVDRAWIEAWLARQAAR
jgi:thiol-disulfide isomerase/thioredoxin